MKIFSDFLALILFFAVYWFTSKTHPEQAIYIATGVAVTVAIIQAAVILYKHKKMDVLQIINFSVVVVFGTIAIIFHNSEFILWKPTIIAWAMAIALAISQIVNKNGLKLILQKEISLPEVVWARLTYAWLSFFIIIGVVNLLVAYNFSQDIWVKYKTFGALGLTVVFAIAQAIYLSKHVVENKEAIPVNDGQEEGKN
ncbi:septation protein A [Neisseria sp. Ec49-e6-T10]|uniref:septation protein A n=1 Tax=Neisseria sp. Ec49-e6-T10 TaxID=3140744 RepID=UPI003EB9A7AA